MAEKKIAKKLAKRKMKKSRGGADAVGIVQDELRGPGRITMAMTRPGKGTGKGRGQGGYKGEE